MGEYVSSPPGWHPDPHDGASVRWWDGQTWTAHVHSGAVPLAPPADAPPPTLPPSIAPLGAEFLKCEAAALEERLQFLRGELHELHKQVVETTDAMLLQEVGIYEYSHPLD